MATTKATISLAQATPKPAETKKTKVSLVQVERNEGTSVSIPHNVKLEDVVENLQRKIAEESQIQEVKAIIPAYPFDGAYAMSLALNQQFGFSTKDNQKDFFGRNSNRDMEVTVNAQGETVTVPWGRFQVPGIEGYLTTSFDVVNDQFVFAIGGEICGRHVPEFQALVALTKQIVAERSIYRGKVFDVSFHDSYGDRRPFPQVTFMDVSGANRPIFSPRLADQLEYDILAYITNGAAVRQVTGGYLKRGILLQGPYGVGKSLTAQYIARTAEANGWTFIYCTDPHEFVDAHMMARAYQPAVIFVEDADKILPVERDDDVDRILNLLDGADSKQIDVVTIFTTNHPEKITPALKRPGRADVTMSVTPPDAETAVALVRHYSAGHLADDDFSETGRVLAGKIPAVIAEAVQRVRVRRVAQTGDATALIRNEDLVREAENIEIERNSTATVDPSTIQRLGAEIGADTLRRVGRMIQREPYGMGTQSTDDILAGILG